MIDYDRLAADAIVTIDRSNGTGPHDPAPDLTAVTGCPALPAGAGLDPTLGKGAGAWLDRYIAHARSVSPMTPTIFHESAGLWLVSMAAARRLKIPMHYGDVYPNLYVLWLATTTLWRKTTALDVARGMAREVFPHLLAPQDTTPEGFLSDLSGREPSNFASLPDNLKELWRQERNYAAQRGLVADELSGLLAAAGRDYNAGLTEAFLRFYDCDPLYTRSTHSKGRIVVRNAYLSLLGASTPAAMGAHVTSERLWANGWWARFALLTPDEARPAWAAPHETDPQAVDTLKSDLRAIYASFPPAIWPDPPEARAVVLGQGVYDAFERYNRALSYDLLTDDLDGRLYGAYGRLPTQALKVATLLAVMDSQAPVTGALVTGAPVIQLAHFARAVAITESWRASAHRALLQATQSDFTKFQERVLRACAPHDEGATLRDIYRQLHDRTPADVQDAVRQLVAVGVLEEIASKGGPQGGRPTSRYKLAR